jgi:hypothetical protein
LPRPRAKDSSPYPRTHSTTTFPSSLALYLSSPKFSRPTHGVVPARYVRLLLSASCAAGRRDSGPALPSEHIDSSLHTTSVTFTHTRSPVDGFPAWPVGDGAIIVRYSSGHIFHYPHPDCYVCGLATAFIYLLFSLSTVTFLFWSVFLALGSTPCAPCLSVVAPRQVGQQRTFSLLHQRPAPAPGTHTYAYNTALVNCWSICGTLLAYYHCP